MRSWFILALVACGGKAEDTHEHTHTTEPTPEPFTLRFAATDGVNPVDCATPFTGDAGGTTYTIGLSDVRFYVSNLVFRDADGNEVAATFDEDAFQYTGSTGWVALVDLTGNATGSCDGGAISFSEGTERTHEAITGSTLVGEVASVSFDVGVPQALMQEVIGANTVEAAPSPLNEMYWSWASGYRHFVFNMTVSDGVDDGEGYLHIGSTDCAAEGQLALEDRDACGFLNTPSVAVDNFDLASGVVSVNLAAALSGLDLQAPVYDPKTWEVIGEQPGVECHSSPDQTDCPTIFESFGVNIASGVASDADNRVFGGG
jgi:uncharacterized repeat protein (TIGR04052 family)